MKKETINLIGTLLRILLAFQLKCRIICYKFQDLACTACSVHNNNNNDCPMCSFCVLWGYSEQSHPHPQGHINDRSTCKYLYLHRMLIFVHILTHQASIQDQSTHCIGIPFLWMYKLHECHPHMWSTRGEHVLVRIMFVHKSRGGTALNIGRWYLEIKLLLLRLLLSLCSPYHY